MLATGSVPLFDNVDLTSKRQPPSCHRVGNAKPSHQPISHDPSFNQPGRSTLVRAVAKSSARGCAHLASTHAWRALELAGLARLWEFPQPFAVATPPATPATPTQQLPASVMPYACRHCAEVPQGRGARAVQLRRRLMHVAFKTTPNVAARSSPVDESVSARRVRRNAWHIERRVDQDPALEPFIARAGGRGAVYRPRDGSNASRH